MKVKIIGTGSMWNEYNSASYMIDNDILVDMPNGMCKNMFKMNIDPRNITHLLITHFHGDHFFDIPFYLLLKSRAQNHTINLYCYNKGRKKINKLTKLAFPNSVENINSCVDLKYVFDSEFMVNDYNVQRIIMEHGRLKPAYGYLFSKDNLYFGFTGDSSLCEGVEYLASKAKYLFCDCMFIKGNNKHMGIDNIEYLSKKYPDCIFVVSHLENITREELKRHKNKNIIIPNDGDTINIK